jgi:hypothetical protein
VNFQVVAQIGALRKEHKVGQRITSRHDLITAVLLDAELVFGVAHHRNSGGKLTLAGKGHRVLDVVDLHRLGSQECHITADLLEVERRHGNPSGELCLGHVDAVLVTIQKLELLRGHALLLAVLQDDAEVIGIIPRDREGKRVVIRRSLHDALQVIRRQPNNELSGVVRVGLLLELVCKKAEMNKNRAGIVHRNHAEAIGVKYQAHLHKNALEGLNEGADGCRLNRLGLHDELRHAYTQNRRRFMKVVRGSRLI